MSASPNNIGPQLGTLNTAPMFRLPAMPNIVSEWAAIMPLVVHLASHRDDYLTAGDVALLGRVSIGLFPKLGTLAGIARLLDRTAEFLDQASTRGDSSSTVWDVRWGSIFPCANGAASAVIARYARAGQGKRTPILMPETLPSSLPLSPERYDSGTSTWNLGGDSKVADSTTEKPTAPSHFRRYQTLHVYYFGRQMRRKKSIGRRLDEWQLSRFSHIASFVLLVGTAVALGLCGAYGTAAIIFCSAVSRLVLQIITIQRPPGYLGNNEAHDACMLVATHVNAMEWHLYTGDRGVVDSLLNKAMFMIPNQPSTRVVLATWWLKAAHILQLLGMTYVAAQKSWDGMFLVFLLTLNWFLRWGFREAGLARYWLDKEGVEVEVKTFKFTGRMAMLGAIQIFSDTKVTSWMDDILPPHPRRDAWLKRIHGQKIDANSFSPQDLNSIERSFGLSMAAANVLREELSKKSV
ncbi:uncharacterized protein K452DRAFT_329921 [Aplosporella prunicola CBS 121167]|uniref:Uncharacterized protein n=1 Tax=Aplosporella prunicola CBS 121167 TaxID=1176127 RepID=A0A6A6AXM8_9PEZI|nr:uncharacterized protein K452DRAFT_329921 [Aplosporella prunicola CBS 121167]KAF2136008.1 hypothetical protein K452DRAFT_329921 [Aplosporella prunicola CBS 121167]